jgi:acyl carrier protein
VLAVISAEADDTPVDQLLPTTELRRGLNLCGLQRLALAFQIEKDFACELDDTAWDAITSDTATVGAVALHVIRNVTSKETT